MDRLNIYIKKIKEQNDSALSRVIIVIVLIALAIVFIPILVAFWIFSSLYNLLMPKRAIEDMPYWTTIETSSDLSLKYHWTTNEEIPEYLIEHFDPSSLLIFKTEPKMEFFNGFFTDFKVERNDGIFVQRIEPNENSSDIKAMPLYFFKFHTREIEMIKDLNGFEIDSKGTPNDFVITAFNENEKWEIHLTT